MDKLLGCVLAAAVLDTAAQLTGGDPPPKEMMLIPAGRIPTRPHDARKPWHNSDPDAIVRATGELKLDLAIDYEHQTQRSKENGKKAPAAGWITKVFARDGAVWGAIDWTSKAAEHITNREYRFFSATFFYDAKTREIKMITGGALTNDPAMYMPALATTRTAEEEHTMKFLEQVRKALGLKDDADEASVLEALTKTVKASAVAVASLAGLQATAKALGLDGDADADAIAKAAAEALEKSKGTADPDLKNYVPRAEFDTVAATLKTMQETTAEADAKAAVDKAVAEGKITPASRDQYLKMARANLAEFEALAKTLPVILAPGEITNLTTEPPRDTEGALRAEELAVCAKMGLDPEAYKEVLKRPIVQEAA